ncbi:dTDP-4-dehydrorhamnose reductase [Micromonospora sp. NPDC051543]|uniref:dTDP-4-dehydrorhamnose reductase n=1 Tax=Micromonospora sp. NPDC051543 TaxID=3364287 RepID=UPI00378D3F67
METAARWLVTGAHGMLGRDIVDALAHHPGASVTIADHATLDVTDPAAVAHLVPGHDIVVNAAGWTNVDAAEDAEDDATAVNGTAVGHLARACADSGACLLHISTDYVFDGTARRPYQEHDRTGPVNAYGRSKLAGEHALLRLLPEQGYLVRTAWLYGEHGRNFVATMLAQAAESRVVRAVADHTGQPTWSRALARQLVELGQAAHTGVAPPGIYHGTSAGHSTWYDLTRALFELAGLDPERVHAVPHTMFPRPAQRPAYGVLEHGRWRVAGVSPQASWREQLAEALRAPVFAALAETARARSPRLETLGR